jgi:hypothetical protein
MRPAAAIKRESTFISAPPGPLSLNWILCRTRAQWEPSSSIQRQTPAADADYCSWMPVNYERDDARRRVMVTVHGALRKSDMLTVIARQRAEETWAYGMLFDLRRVTEHPTIADLRELMDEASSRRQAESPRGPVAILATDAVMYGIACTYAALGHAKLTIRVFRHVDEADRWLTEETKPAGN